MIHAFNFDGTNGVPTPFSVGLPLPKATFWPEQKLQIVTEAGLPVISSVTASALWDDKSIRWCQIEGYSDQRKSQKYFVTESPASIFKKQDCVFEKDGAFLLKSKDLTLQVSADSFLSVKQVTSNDLVALELSPIFSLKQTDTKFKLINSRLLTKTSSCNHPLYATLKQQYKTQLDTHKKYLYVTVEYKLDYPTNKLKIALSVHNPMPLIPQNGQWDLGNENSIELTQFGLKIALPKGGFSVANTGTNADAIARASAAKNAGVNDGTNHSTSHKNRVFKHFEQWSLLINNSGGENWLSKNHVDKNGLIHQKERGAVVFEVDKKQTHTYRELRPSLAFMMSDEAQRFAIHVDNMWQKFPLEVAALNDELDINFCEKNTDAGIELQPGEIKFHSLNIALLQTPVLTNANSQPPTMSLNPDIFCSANTIPWLTQSITHSPLTSIVSLGLTGERNFFAKREAVDEFGWRNFGDIYADHEAIGYKGDDIFVSHYNNQYDPLQGFLKQWVITGDPKWKELADDLFEHIVNIDIYHSELDKQEYNGGLFWHTDHYVEAETATHRTYSKRQQKGVYEDHAGGGGPGSHHCYTSGLALYYQLTGNESAKNAVIQLGNWITYFFEGDGTLLGSLLQYRNRAIVRNPLTGRYPLDRGVANYVNVLLDSYELTANRLYVERASSIITQTFHFTDIIAERNFEDIENTWYYIVFMQSVAKYLWMCETVYGIDHDYASIKKSFLHYIEWIATQEQPYLDNHQKLEYPNDTWTAQDLRKIMVLKIALNYADLPHLKELMQQKVDSLTRYVENKLCNSNEKDFTRVIALVMQNNIGDISQIGLTNDVDPEVTIEHRTAAFSFVRFAGRFIKGYSLTREFKHLLIRFPQLRLK
ncbi:hypothetical protein [Glaciecola sp. 33A]|uniref:hypothetical protein n=1 Tax=Glaciecola sp. 33A TaxID=2057807 RepID=UPI000C3444C4|nr:hypothetical protein [Glaciecola sp. 33A]PKI02358.1 hypothetical protein CXF81_06765 [Glaciecola sp. 33A]